MKLMLVLLIATLLFSKGAEKKSKSAKSGLLVIPYAKAEEYSDLQTTPTTEEEVVSSASSSTHSSWENITITSSTQPTTSTSTESSNSSCYVKAAPRVICPEGFISSLADNNEICVWIKEKQSFPPSCPYPHPLNYSSAKQHIERLFFRENVWLHAARDATSGFPDFEWLENGMYYRTPVMQDISNLEKGFGKNCLMVSEGVIFRVNCSDQYTTVCVYEYSWINTLNVNEICNFEGYDKCMIANYDFRHQKCFCQKIDRSRPRKQEFCKKLIEPLAFQSELLARQLISTGSCWIGLYEDITPEKTYRWLSTKEVINYTRWVNPHDCQYPQGAYQFDLNYPQNGWVLLEDQTLDCGLCELEVNYETPYIQLQHVRSKNIIQLLVSNPKAISSLGNLFQRYYDIYCFSDSGEKDFKGAIEILIEASSSNKSSVVYDIALTENRPSHYWCEAFQYPSFTPIKSNRIIAFNKTDNYGHEFSLHVSFKYDIYNDPVISKYFIKICDYLKETIMNNWEALLALRPMRGNIKDENSMDMIIHITTKNTQQTATEQSRILTTIISSIQEMEMKLSSLYSSEVCLYNTSLTFDGEILEWPETRLGATAVPTNRICLDEDNNVIPVTRDCLGDFLSGAKWEDPKGNCYAKRNHSKITEELFDLTKDDVPTENITEALGRITKESFDIKVIDVHFIATILEKLEVTKQINNGRTNNYVDIISNIMNFDEAILSEAQSLLNSTDKILSLLDDTLNTKEMVTSIVSQNLLVEILYITDENMIGLVLHKGSQEANTLEQYRISLAYKNFSIENMIEDENIETVILLPSYELEDINVITAPIKLIATVFYNDFLFNEKEDQESIETRNKIISISAPDLTGFLSSPLKIIFRTPKHFDSSKNCSHWNYGLDDLMVSMHGYWKTNGISNSYNNFIEICEFYHMTHFGLFLRDNSEVDPNDTALSILTAVGSSLSLLGIIPIFITAIVFKRWRSKAKNILLLNFCLTITLQIIVTFSLYAINEDGVLCKTLGILIHYFILAEFCWMLAVAILEYKRFVVVFAKRDSNILIKNLLIGWGIPLLPVVITALINPENYAFNSNHKFCYVTGNYFTYALLLPIILILINNLAIFIRILCAISPNNVTSTQNNRNYKLEILLAILLFFILGISWLFGIIGAFGGGIWFTYVFCILATIRGLVLFSFFIVANKETSLLWRKQAKYYVETNVSHTN